MKEFARMSTEQSPDVVQEWEKSFNFRAIGGRAANFRGSGVPMKKALTSRALSSVFAIDAKP
jgi:hypothetical protein